MAGLSPSHSMESERAEWEVVLAGFSRTPRLAKLLRHVGDLYFQNRTDEINEFQIATKVLGRSERVFDASKDSIARVEAFRLRKRLKEYYETEGKDHEVVISLPPGSYVPSFFHRAGSAGQRPTVLDTVDMVAEAKMEGVAHPADAGVEDADPQADPPKILQNRFPRSRIVLAVLLATALFLVAGFFVLRHRGFPGGTADTENGSAMIPAGNSAQAGSGRVPIRLLCGYEGTPRIDSAGNYWEADRFFDGGIARSRPDQIVTRTSDPMLFEHWRLDDFSYDIPLAPGPWELHLYFVAPPTEEATIASFDVFINGKVLLDGFQIADDAQGANVADERVFRDIYPDSDGKLHLRFTKGRAAPSLNAIELIPGLPHKQFPIRLVTQRTSVTDHDGNVWRPDTYYQNGHLSDLPQIISGTRDPKLYGFERYGRFTYSIPVDPRGRYTLVLHFAELYWGADPGVGRRIFRVFCNGTTLLDNFDIFKEAGSLHALTKTFSHLRPTIDGKLDLTFERLENNATVSAIEVIDESE